MENISFYSANEIIILITAVLLGTGAYLSFMIKIKGEKISMSGIVYTFIMNLFVTYFFSELLNAMNHTKYKGLVQLASAYFAQYFLVWIHKNRNKILDSGAKKVGVDVNKDSDENNNQNPTGNE